MIKRTIEISNGPTFLNVQNDQLLISRDHQLLDSIPCEDVGLLLVDNQATTYTHAVCTRLLQNGAAIIFCDQRHLPCGLLLPYENNDLHTQRLRGQINASLPTRKRLWSQIVRHKIRGQSDNLPHDSPVRGQLLALAQRVKSGDSSNCEGLAARFYWPAFLGAEFVRDPDGLPPNQLLNYGYMVMRAACARALVAGGLHPAIGLQHSNRNNPFCLADDLVEIFRPRVDQAVLQLMKQGGGFIDQPAKQALLSLLTHSITVAGQSGPLMVQLHRIVSSLVRGLQGEQAELDLPE